jgi:hypothetical protein
MTDKLSPGSFVATYGPLAQQASRQLGGLAVGCILGQWAVETGWGSSKLAGDHNLAGMRYYGSPYGGVAVVDVGGFIGFRTLPDFLTGYEHTMRLPYYTHVVGVRDTRAACAALGASPWDAGHYKANGWEGGSLWAAYADMEPWLVSGPVTPAPTFARYVVKAGDSLSSIAAKHNTTWQRLYNDNRAAIGPNPGLIRPGLVLRIRT